MIFFFFFPFSLGPSRVTYIQTQYPIIHEWYMQVNHSVITHEWPWLMCWFVWVEAYPPKPSPAVLRECGSSRGSAFFVNGRMIFFPFRVSTHLCKRCAWVLWAKTTGTVGSASTLKGSGFSFPSNQICPCLYADACYVGKFLLECSLSEHDNNT